MSLLAHKASEGSAYGAGDFGVSESGSSNAQKHIVIDARIRWASTGRYHDRLVEHLQAVDQDNKYTILVQPDDDWQPKNPNFQREDCSFAQFSFNPLDQIRFPRQLKALKPDLVHFPMNQQPIFYSGKVVTSTLDLTMLRFTRSKGLPLPIHWLKMLGYRFLFWHSNRKSKAIITISNYVKDELAKKYPFTVGKTTTTYCAAEPELSAKAVEPVFAQDSGLRTQDFVLYVGSPFPHKNLEKLLTAFELLKPSQPELKLILVGKKEYYYEKLEELASHSPYYKDMIFTGFVSDAELKWLYQHAQVYVLPSLSEGFGLPGLEAMVHGCPVVSSNATCLPEVYQDAVVYFDPQDPHDMAQKIEQVLNDKSLRSKLVSRGSAQAAKYSWRRMAEQTLDVYESVLAEA